MSREAFESRYNKSRLRRWAVGIYPDEYSDPQVQLDWALWQAAQADAFERAAKLCEDRYFVDTAASNAPTASDYVKIRHIAWAVGALNCVDAIRALAKEST